MESFKPAIIRSINGTASMLQSATRLLQSISVEQSPAGQLPSQDDPSVQTPSSPFEPLPPLSPLPTHGPRTPTYRVFLAYSISSDQGPHNQVIFLETDPSPRKGYIFEVKGNLVVGMRYSLQHVGAKALEPYCKLAMIGVVAQQDARIRIETVCRLIPLPGAQFRLNGQRVSKEVPTLCASNHIWCLRIQKKG